MTHRLFPKLLSCSASLLLDCLAVFHDEERISGCDKFQGPQ
jgi:hypothetical protein